MSVYQIECVQPIRSCYIILFRSSVKCLEGTRVYFVVYICRSMAVVQEHRLDVFLARVF